MPAEGAARRRPGPTADVASLRVRPLALKLFSRAAATPGPILTLRRSAVRPPLPGPGRPRRAVPAAGRGRHAGVPGGVAAADRRRPDAGDAARRMAHRRRPLRAAGGARVAIARVHLGALLHGELARRAHHHRPAQGRLRQCAAAAPVVLRDAADRRSPVAPDGRHDAGADGRRIEPVGGPAQLDHDDRRHR